MPCGVVKFLEGSNDRAIFPTTLDIDRIYEREYWGENSTLRCFLMDEVNLAVTSRYLGSISEII